MRRGEEFLSSAGLARRLSSFKSQVAASLLLFLEEEDAFWMMCAIIEELVPASYFSTTLMGVQTDQRVLRQLIVQYLPRLDKLLQEHDIGKNVPIAFLARVLCRQRSLCSFHKGRTRARSKPPGSGGRGSAWSSLSWEGSARGSPSPKAGRVLLS